MMNKICEDIVHTSRKKRQPTQEKVISRRDQITNTDCTREDIGLVIKIKIFEYVRDQHWCHFSWRNKTKISVSLHLCLLLLRRRLLLHRLRCRCCCCCCWLAQSSFVNQRNRTAPQWLPLMFYIFSRSDICMRSAPNNPNVLDTMVCYPPTLQNSAHLNPDEHSTAFSWLIVKPGGFSHSVSSAQLSRELISR